MRGLTSMVWVAAVATAAPVAARAAVADSDCGRLGSTIEIVRCHDAETRRWDRRLNGAFQALQQRLDAGRRQPLTAAQRLWVRYRDANCGFYAAGEGSIGRVLAADCVRAMTRQRACELESADRWESAAASDCR